MSCDLLLFPLMAYTFYATHSFDTKEALAESVAGMFQERDLYREA